MSCGRYIYTLTSRNNIFYTDNMTILCCNTYYTWQYSEQNTENILIWIDEGVWLPCAPSQIFFKVNAVDCWYI